MTPNHPTEFQREGIAHLASPRAIVHLVDRAADDRSVTICGARAAGPAQIVDDIAKVTCQACSARGEWRCATCSGPWTNGVPLLGDRFHPTCDPWPAQTSDGSAVWDGY